MAIDYSWLRPFYPETAQPFVWRYTVTPRTTDRTNAPTTDEAPVVPDQTSQEAILTLEEKVDRLMLELARLRREAERAVPRVEAKAEKG